MWVFYIRQVNTDIDVQKQFSVILPIQSFFILEQASKDLNNVPLIFKNCIPAINMFDSYSKIGCSNQIYSVKNTLKKIYLGGYLLGEFKSEYYNYKNANFELLFQQCTYSSVDKMYHPYIVNEQKLNMYKAYY